MDQTTSYIYVLSELYNYLTLTNIYVQKDRCKNKKRVFLHITQSLLSSDLMCNFFSHILFTSFSSLQTKYFKMQMIDINKQSTDRVIDHVKEYFTKLSNQLVQNQSEVSFLDGDKVLEIYGDILQILDGFETVQFSSIDYWRRLLNLVTVDLSRTKREKLMCITSFTLIQSLMNKSIFEDMIKSLNKQETLDTLAQFLLSVDIGGLRSELTVPMGINMMDHMIYHIVNGLKSDVVLRCCYRSLQQVIGRFDACWSPINQLRSISPLSLNSSKREMILNYLQTIANDLIDEGSRDLVAIMVTNSGCIEVINAILQKQVSTSITVYCKIINFLVVDKLSLNHYPEMIWSNKFLKLRFADNQMVFLSLEINERNLKQSFKFMLECLNHAEWVENKMNLIYLLWGFNQIFHYCQLPFGRSLIYSTYNNFQPYVSMVSISQHLASAVMKQLLKELPIYVNDQLVSKLKGNSLPPFPKEPFILDKYTNPKPKELDMLTEENYLTLVLLKCMRLISMFFAEDFETDLGDSNEINFKIRSHKVDGFLNIIIWAGYLSYEFKKNDILAGETGLMYSKDILFKLLNMYSSPGEEMEKRIIWATFIKEAYAYTVSELRFLPFFQNIYEKILIGFKQDVIIEDPLIKKEITRYFNRFGADTRKFPEVARYTGVNYSDNNPILITKEESNVVATTESDISSLSEEVSTNVSKLSISESNYSANSYASSSQSSQQLAPISRPQNQLQSQHLSTPRLQSQHANWNLYLPSLYHPTPTQPLLQPHLGHYSYSSNYTTASRKSGFNDSK